MTVALKTRTKSSWASRSLAERANAYFQIRLGGSLAILTAILIVQKTMPTDALKTAAFIVLIDIGVLLFQKISISMDKPLFFTWASLIIASVIGSIGMHFGGGAMTLSLGIQMILIWAAALVFLKRNATFFMAAISIFLYGIILFVETTQILPPHNRTFNAVYTVETRLLYANALLGFILLFITMLLSGKAAEALGQWSIQLEDEVERKNAELHNLLTEKENNLILLQNAYNETLRGWVKILEMRDKETKGHSERVTHLTVKIAQEMGINDKKELLFIFYGSLLHDIGKIAISDTILRKPNILTPEERKIMEQHTEYAYEWLKDVEFLRPALDIPRYHHEKWDGTGYTHGLKAEQIPLSARIFAVADCWDALVNDRIYRTAWTYEKAISHIAQQAGKEFDPQVVENFLKVIQNENLLSTSESSSPTSA